MFEWAEIPYHHLARRIFTTSNSDGKPGSKHTIKIKTVVFLVIILCNIEVTNVSGEYPKDIFRVLYSGNGDNTFFRNATIWCHNPDDQSLPLPPQNLKSHNTLTRFSIHNTNLSLWLGSMEDPHRPTAVWSLTPCSGSNLLHNNAQQSWYNRQSKMFRGVTAWNPSLVLPV
jgi:hypothetical protein